MGSVIAATAPVTAMQNREKQVLAESPPSLSIENTQSAHDKTRIQDETLNKWSFKQGQFETVSQWWL